MKEPYLTADKQHITYVSEEIERVLGMSLPAAVVVQLPRIGGGMFMQASTDILLYFPTSGQVIVFDETLCDPRRKQQGTDINYYGTFDCYPKYREPTASGRVLGLAFDHNIDPNHRPRKIKNVPRYNYSVELMPFLVLHGAPCPNQCKASFIIDFEGQLEISIDYDDDNRDKEVLELLYGPDDGEKKHIASWRPDRDKEKQLLTWTSTEGTTWAKTLPHIRGYHEEDDYEGDEEN